MSDKIEPMTHIDIRAVRNLLSNRLSEGRDIMKTASVPQNWRQTERQFQDKCRQALKLIDEAIAIKEGKVNEVSQNPVQAPTESNHGSRKTGIQNQEVKA